MARSLSARKRVRQNLKHHLYNKAIKSRVKTAVKSFRIQLAQYQAPKEAGKTADPGPLQSALRRVSGVIDKAAKIKVIPKNRASRLKGRLTMALNKLTTAK